MTAAAPRSIPTSRATPRAGARLPFYGWSEDKARQYGVPQRRGFRRVRAEKGFKLANLFQSPPSAVIAGLDG